MPRPGTLPGPILAQNPPLLALPAPFSIQRPNAFRKAKPAIPVHFSVRISLHMPYEAYATPRHAPRPHFGPKPTFACLASPLFNTEAKRVPQGKTCDPGAFLSPNKLAHALRGLCHAQARSQAPFWPKTHLCLPCQPPLQYRGQTRSARQNLRSRCISQSE